MNRFLAIAIFLIHLLILSACSTSKGRIAAVNIDGLPQPPREFRAAWVATVANINWPSRPDLSVEDQKIEATRLLDLLADHHFNAAIFQVRPQCDALYASDLEPWSYYLTGSQGVAPEPYYDPLEFWISEAHKRGLELHVWLNPYRAHHPSGGEITENSLVRRKPELMVELSNGFWWMDPAKKKTQDHSYAVVMDIIDRYDIDGVHFDDYFYPYPSYNNDKDFPDDQTYLDYQQSGGKLARADWRREAVNTFIAKLYRGIKKNKKHIKFGISPFGIWRPGHPESIQGFDQYDELYADARLWLRKGWVDYFAPQLYWPVNQIPQSFPVLLNWWVQQNTKVRHLWPGINIGRQTGEKATDEAINQIMISRAMLDQQPGVIHWSIGPLVKNDSLVEKIFHGPYVHQALVPAMPWLSKKIPSNLQLSREKTGDRSVLKLKSNTEFKSVIIYYRTKSVWDYAIVPCDDSEIDISLLETVSPDSGKILLSIVDRFGQLSKPVVYNFRT